MVPPVALPVDVEALAPLAETMLRPSSYPFDFERDNLPPKPTSDRLGPIAFPRGVSGAFVAASRRPPSNEARNVFPGGSLHLDCNLAPFFWIDCVNLPSIRETKRGLQQHRQPGRRGCPQHSLAAPTWTPNQSSVSTKEMVRPRNEAQDNAGFYAKEAVTSMLHAQQLNGDTDSALDDALRTNATHRTFTLRAPQMNDEAGRAL